jgi:hypothetical protein
VPHGSHFIYSSLLYQHQSPLHWGETGLFRASTPVKTITSIGNKQLSMDPTKELNYLLRHISPRQNPGKYVFVSLPTLENISENEIMALIREREGITLVLNKLYADLHKLPYDFVAAWITLEVHSSLEAVGLTAAFSKALGQAGISCNVIAGFYHDHIFVPEQQADRALEALLKLKENFN